MNLSKNFFDDFKSGNIKIGDIINFNRSEYEIDEKINLSDAEFQKQWDNFKELMSTYITFKPILAKFEPNGNGVSIVVTRLYSSPEI
jgi:hypothetical protein